MCSKPAGFFGWVSCAAAHRVKAGSQGHPARQGKKERIGAAQAAQNASPWCCDAEAGGGGGSAYSAHTGWAKTRAPPLVYSSCSGWAEGKKVGRGG